MASSTIVDTDIIIDVGRGIPEAINCLQWIKSNSRLTISVVTQMELMAQLHRYIARHRWR